MKYPTFVKQGGKTMAFLRKDVMFMLSDASFGVGAGFEFRIYKTRATCRRYETEYGKITHDQFLEECRKTMGQYMIMLAEYLPAELMQLSHTNQKQLGS